MQAVSDETAATSEVVIIMTRIIVMHNTHKSITHPAYSISYRNRPCSHTACLANMVFTWSMCRTGCGVLFCNLAFERECGTITLDSIQRFKCRHNDDLQRSIRTSRAWTTKYRDCVDHDTQKYKIEAISYKTRNATSRADGRGK